MESGGLMKPLSSDSLEILVLSVAHAIIKNAATKKITILNIILIFIFLILLVTWQKLFRVVSIYWDNPVHPICLKRLMIRNHCCPTKVFKRLQGLTSLPTPSPKERGLRTLRGNGFQTNDLILSGQQ